ncbi:DUF3363 domain-containing protein [Rhizobium ruizarguesonis]|uniref:DUF3363 domain-containing protein n=1 Tax=Rhizobium TaxID=379 RepID=UPI000360AE13|nr:DUF3363 domain-containing protein [Rhizobium laguerreae]TBC19555.1 DUF3363 domain-containing protein [Rhizobium ruizarguesonis]
MSITRGRFAVIERSKDFTLRTWRPAPEHLISKTISGIMRADGIGAIGADARASICTYI